MGAPRLKPITQPLPDPLALPIIKDRIRKREAIKGPRDGDWVIMLDGSVLRLTSNGIYKTTNNAIRIATDWIADDGHGGSFLLHRDGKIGHSGGNHFHDLSDHARLIDTGETRPGAFCAFESWHPEIGMNARGANKHGVDFELPCRVYRVVSD